MDADAIVFEEPDQLLARCGPVLVWASRNKLGDASLARVREALEQHAHEHPQGVALLSITVGAGELPKASNRRRIARGLSSLGERLQAVACVFEGDKPWLAQAHALFDGILGQLEAMTTGSRAPMLAFADRLDAIVWLGGVVRDSMQRPIEVDELTEAVELACARIRPG
ncbi:MAG: hypothetical protein R6X02_35525 [Enhygromyxa sp.]